MRVASAQILPFSWTRGYPRAPSPAARVRAIIRGVHRPALQGQIQSRGLGLSLAQKQAEIFAAALGALQRGRQQAVEALERLQGAASG